MRDPNDKETINAGTPTGLAKYGVGAAAVAAAAIPSAHADVQYFNPGDVTGNSIYFDLESTAASNSAGTPGVTDFRLYFQGIANPQKPAIAAYSGSNNGILTQARGTAGSGGVALNYALRLNAGDTIGSGGNFTTSGYLNNTAGPTGPFTGGQNLGDWHVGDTGFLGLNLAASNGASEPFYGWAELTLNNMDASGAGEFTLHRYAYDDVAGESIQAGQVPEPSAALLLILGAGGVTALRARQKRKRAA